MSGLCTLPGLKQSKFDSKADNCILLGYARHSESIHLNGKRDEEDLHKPERHLRREHDSVPPTDYATNRRRKVKIAYILHQLRHQTKYKNPNISQQQTINKQK